MIVTEGLEQVTARRLARDAGCAVGTLYNLFDDLNAVLLEVLAGFMDEIDLVVKRALQDTTCHSPEERILHLSAVYTDFVIANAPLWQALFQRVRPSLRPFPDWYREREARLFAQLAKELEDLVEQPSGMDLFGTAEALWAAVHGMVALAASQDGAAIKESNARRHISTIVAAVIRGLRTDALRSPQPQ